MVRLIEKEGLPELITDKLFYIINKMIMGICDIFLFGELLKLLRL